MKAIAFSLIFALISQLFTVRAGPLLEKRAARCHVSIPPEYVNSGVDSHTDFCTASPDTWGEADFRGPCARHDLCFDKLIGNGEGEQSCNNQFLRDLTAECKCAYGSRNPLRYTCISTAHVYFAAVSAATKACLANERLC
ncbi:hypothetical protein BJ742DRAFT_831839 [Cladochytrium replicatum]|nr:hypothetical protein BJ742DRAFT_831839 [Cladochytrium replicatum]